MFFSNPNLEAKVATLWAVLNMKVVNSGGRSQYYTDKHKIIFKTFANKSE